TVNEVINSKGDVIGQWNKIIYEGIVAKVCDENGKWGYINKNGKIILNPEWDYIGKFSEGFAKAEKDGKEGFVKIITLMPLPIDPLPLDGDFIVMQINNPFMCINYNSKMIDKENKNIVPTIYNNRTILPIRAVVEALGGTVSWEESESKITIQYETKKIEMWTNKKIAIVNGQTMGLEVEPIILMNRTMLPLRFITESIGYKVYWNEENKIITIMDN
ncbi:MAG TPA: stalk domain-containing protein, partial [Clostridia bacterium]